MPLAQLLTDMAGESPPRVPQASPDAPFPAELDGRLVFVSAVLERTAVYSDFPLDTGPVPRQLAGLERFVVDPARVPATERRDLAARRRVEFRNGRRAKRSAA